MVSVLFTKKEGYPVYCVLKDGEKQFSGGVTKDGELFCERGTTFPELMLRAVVNKCMGGGARLLYAKDEWGADLARFGFVPCGDRYVCACEDLKLPHDCKKGE